jgi:hypothetical protein
VLSLDCCVLIFNINAVAILYRRADQAKFRREILSAGFRLVGEPVIAGLDENYAMLFEVDAPRDISL